MNRFFTPNGKSGNGVLRICLFSVLCLGFGCADQKAYQHLNIAVFEEKVRNFGPALAAFQAAVEAKPDDPYLRYQLGRAYLLRGMYDEAVLEMELALKEEPSYLAVCLDLAVAFEALERSEAAIEWLKYAIQAVPGHPGPYRALTEIYFSSDRLNEALNLLEDARTKWSKAMWVHYRLGHLFQQLNMQDQAEGAFGSILNLRPKSKQEYHIFWRAHAVLGNVLFGQEKYQKAVEIYKKAVMLNPGDHSSLNNLAWLFAIQRTHLDEGIQYSHLSLQLFPNSPSYLDTLAELNFLRGEHQRAVKIIRIAIAMKPVDPQLRKHLQNQLKKFLAEGREKA